MYRVVIANQCACFKKSDLKASISLKSKDEALLKAIEINKFMNDTFCHKHQFEVQEVYDNFMISFYEEDKQPCCGNGCCF